MRTRTPDPFREIEAMRRDFERNFGLLARSFPRAAFTAAAEPAPVIPAITIREDEAAYIIDAALPAIDPAKLEVTYEQGKLTLAGERPGVESPEASRHRVERWSGKFSRAIKLPAQIDSQKITAEYKHGVLRVTAPKAAEAQPRRIDIKTA